MYGKLFEAIFDSSIMEEDLPTRYLFQCMIGLADQHGVVDMTVQALARRVRLPVNAVSKALTRLSLPDPSSRSPDDDGRRIVLLDEHRDWGWRLVNYAKYRDTRSQADRKSYMREYMRKRRAQQRQPVSLPLDEKLTGSNGKLTVSSLAHAAADAEIQKKNPPSPPAGAGGGSPGRPRRRRRNDPELPLTPPPPTSGPESHAGQVAARVLAAADSETEPAAEDRRVVVSEWGRDWPLAAGDREFLEHLARGE